MKRKPQQLTINIEENYPYLYEYVKSRRDASIIRDTLKVMDEMVKKYPQIPEKYFGLSLPELVHELLEGVLSLREILSKDERMGERIYELWGYDYHPLTVATGNAPPELVPRDRDGKEIPYEKKFGMKPGEFSIKHWIQGLVFWNAFCSLEDLARGMELDDTLLGSALAANVGRLLDVQPALRLQDTNGIPMGTLIPGTALFDTGIPAELIGSTCHACHFPDTLFEMEQAVGCKQCRAGYRKGNDECEGMSGL